MYLRASEHILDVTRMYFWLHLGSSLWAFLIHGNLSSTQTECPMYTTNHFPLLTVCISS